MKLFLIIFTVLILTSGPADAGIPERVISLSPIITETIFLLGAQERVVAGNPDIILLSLMGTSRKAAEAEKEKWMGFRYLTAAKQNRIFVVDPEMICSPTPSSFASGLKYLLRLIHPEAMP